MDEQNLNDNLVSTEDVNNETDAVQEPACTYYEEPRKTVNTKTIVAATAATAGLAGIGVFVYKKWIKPAWQKHKEKKAQKQAASEETKTEE